MPKNRTATSKGCRSGVAACPYDPDSVERLGRWVAALRAQIGDSREVAARLVDAHGPRVRLLLHPYRKHPEVAPYFALPSRNSPGLVGEALALIRRHGRHAAAVELARQHGLGVFDVLNRHATQTEIRALLGLKPRHPRGRPSGSTIHDREACLVALLHDWLKWPRARLLRAMGRNPRRCWPELRDTRDLKWYRRRLRRGRALIRDSASSPDAPIIAFVTAYLRRG